VSIGARAVNSLIQIGPVILLARLLSPEDYGLVSMVTTVTAWALMLVPVFAPCRSARSVSPSPTS
jgi:O-antigen/teichoic acid export membrane protein